MLSHRTRSPRAGSARSAGRWVGLGASALITATGLLVTPYAASVASADSQIPVIKCTYLISLVVIFSRLRLYVIFISPDTPKFRNSCDTSGSIDSPLEQG